MGFHSLFVDHPAAIGEGWQGIEHRERYVPPKISFQFRVETNRTQTCEQKPTYLLMRCSEEMSNSDSLWLSVLTVWRVFVISDASIPCK